MQQGEWDLQDKVVVTTGGESELSLLVVLAMLRSGATVHAFVPTNGAAPRLRAAAPPELRSRLICHAADLSRLSDVKQTASAIRGTVDGIDVLVDIAETFESDFVKTEDGIERTFAYNHLARFVVVNLLMGKLRARPGSRLLSVSSMAHIYHDVDPKDWETSQDYDGWVSFCRSKQTDILFTKALARRVDPEDVTVNALDGGLQRDIVTGADVPFFIRFLRPFVMRPAERVAGTVMWLATAPEVAGVTGKYFVEKDAKRPADATLDEATQEALWSASLEYTGLGPLGHTTGSGLPVLR